MLYKVLSINCLFIYLPTGYNEIERKDSCTGQNVTAERGPKRSGHGVGGGDFPLCHRMRVASGRILLLNFSSDDLE
jgi:hypothetical protein